MLGNIQLDNLLILAYGIALGVVIVRRLCLAVACQPPRPCFRRRGSSSPRQRTRGCWPFAPTALTWTGLLSLLPATSHPAASISMWHSRKEELSLPKLTWKVPWFFLKGIRWRLLICFLNCPLCLLSCLSNGMAALAALQVPGLSWELTSIKNVSSG